MTPPATAATARAPMAETTERRCTTCGEVKQITEFYVNGGTCRRRECRACVTIGNTEYHRRCYETRRSVRAQHRAQREMPEASFETELAIVLACWEDCVAEGRPAIDRMMLKLRDEVADLADVLVGHHIVAVIGGYYSGEIALDDVYRSVAAMGEAAA